MCGIVGYIGNGAVSDILLSGLKNLEYRGYDSSGLALNDNQQIKVYKAPGKLHNLYELMHKEPENPKVFKGIGHIRWATHGKASLENAHPHLSNDGKLVLVHNGIIENYQELKEKLQSEGFVFHSATDTETAVHLIDKEYKKCHQLEQAVIRAVKLLKGAYAFCIMHIDEPDNIIAVRHHAPLILSTSQNGNYIASDIPALIGKADKVIYMEDDELAIVSRDNVIVKNFEGIIKLKKAEPIEMNPENISKRGYDHFMLKEIMEQPDILRHILADTIQNTDEEIVFPTADIKSILKNVSRLEIIACGTSLHAAVVAKGLIERLSRISVEVTAASEYIYQTNLTDEHTLSIGISQSGETADTITAVRQSKEAGAKILVLTNRLNSSIVRYADAVLPLNAGIEVSVAATKSYTAQLMVLSLLALLIAEQKQTITNKYASCIKQELLALPAKMEEVLSKTQPYKDLAIRYKDYKNFIYMARGINLATAEEGALKLKEISYINATGYPAGELKHGPIALLDENMPVLAILPQNSAVYSKILSNCEEAKARHAKIIGLTDQNAKLSSDIFDDLLRVPETLEILTPLLYALPMQLFAYYVATSLNREVDQPRNLAKSVTVE